MRKIRLRFTHFWISPAPAIHPQQRACRRGSCERRQSHAAASCHRAAGPQTGRLVRIWSSRAFWRFQEHARGNIQQLAQFRKHSSAKKGRFTATEKRELMSSKLGASLSHRSRGGAEWRPLAGRRGGSRLFTWPNWDISKQMTHAGVQPLCTSSTTSLNDAIDVAVAAKY